MNLVSLFLLQVVCLEFLSDKYHPLHKTNVKERPPMQICVTSCLNKSNLDMINCYIAGVFPATVRPFIG